METTKWWALFLVIICTFFTSSAQLLLKAGVMKVTTFQSIMINYALLGGILLYAVAAVLLIFALKFGELSVLYPAIATSFIWVNLFSVFLFHEIIPFLRWVGVGFIILGISSIGMGSKTMVQWRNT